VSDIVKVTGGEEGGWELMSSVIRRPLFVRPALPLVVPYFSLLLSSSNSTFMNSQTDFSS